MRLIYLDTCIVIYFIEKHPIHSAKIELLMEQSVNTTFCYSPLIRMETSVMPFRTKDFQLQRLYELFFDSQSLLPITDQAFDKAAQLRADFPSLKTPDAIHLATAICHNCNEFWTNDNRLEKIVPNLVKNIL
jgi:uncharacterized protein